MASPDDGGSGAPLASKHDQNRAEKRERLLKSAVEAFTETGFENSTVSDVVRRAGMTPSTFYNYYRDKEGLRHELLSQAAAKMIRGLSAIRARDVGVEEHFGSACRGLFKAIVEDKTNAKLLRKNLPMLRSLLDDNALAPVYSALRGDLQAATDKGLAEPVDADYAVAVLRAATFEVVVVLLAKEDPDIDQAVSFLSHVLAAAFNAR